jgi:hypothetical protein
MPSPSAALHVAQVVTEQRIFGTAPLGIKRSNGGGVQGSGEQEGEKRRCCQLRDARA